jgi:hypothetical protein
MSVNISDVTVTMDLELGFQDNPRGVLRHWVPFPHLFIPVMFINFVVGLISEHVLYILMS